MTDSPSYPAALREKTIKGIAWSALDNWGTRIISLSVFLILARLLTPEAFGLVALAMVVITFIEVFAEQGFSEALIQRRQLTPEHLDSAFWINLVAGIILTALIVLIATPIASIFGQPAIAPIISWLSLSCLFVAVSGVQKAILRRRFSFRTLAVMSLIATLFGGVAGVAMALSGFGVWSLIGQQLVYGLTGTVLIWLLSDWRPRLTFNPQYGRELISFGAPLIGTKLVHFVSTKSDDLLIGYFLGPTALGFYMVGYRVLTVLIQLLNRSVDSVLLSTFSRLQENEEKLKEAFYTSTRFMSLIAFPLFLLMGALAQEIVPVVFGSHWLPSMPVMQVLAVYGAISSVLYLTGTVLIAKGKPSWQLRIGLLNVFLNVVLFVLVVKWGIVAVAAAFTLRAIALSPVPLWAVSRLIRIEASIYIKLIAPALIASLLMMGSIIFLRQLIGNNVSDQVFLVIALVFGTTIYSVAIYIFTSKADRERFFCLLMSLPGRYRGKSRNTS